MRSTLTPALSQRERETGEQPAIQLFAELGWTRVPAFQNLLRTRDLLLLPVVMVTMSVA